MLPIFGKIFEKVVFNRIYNFHLNERLLNPSQSEFCPSDSFDCNPPLEVRSVFLDITKAFEKVWHKGLLYKPKSMGISEELLN